MLEYISQTWSFLYVFIIIYTYIYTTKKKEEKKIQTNLFISRPGDFVFDESSSCDQFNATAQLNSINIIQFNSSRVSADSSAHVLTQEPGGRHLPN